MAQAKEIKPNPPELTNPLEKEEEARQKAEAEKLRAEAAAAEAAAAVVVTGTEFTGFTGKKSQIPTLSTPAQVRAALEIAARFTGFTYTKVQILTQILTLRTRRREQQPLQGAPRAYLFYWLYWYKSTNTDAAHPQARAATTSGLSSGCWGL